MQRQALIELGGEHIAADRPDPARRIDPGRMKRLCRCEIELWIDRRELAVFAPVDAAAGPDRPHVTLRCYRYALQQRRLLRSVIHESATIALEQLTAAGAADDRDVLAMTADREQDLVSARLYQ